MLSDIFRTLGLCCLVGVTAATVCAQTPQERYEEFRRQTRRQYEDFRQKCNREYAEFMLTAWKQFEGKAPMPAPPEETPVPALPYEEEKDRTPPVETVPEIVPREEPEPAPLPVAPVPEVPEPEPRKPFSVDFFGVSCPVRLPDEARLKLSGTSAAEISRGWKVLSTDAMNNAIRDCLEARVRYNLCDWAYLGMLARLGETYCSDPNGAALLTAWLYCQSGYQMRLAEAGGRLYVLFGSKHTIFEKPYYVVGGTTFYPYGEMPRSISICDAPYQGEKPMSLYIPDEQKLGSTMSDPRTIKANGYPSMKVQSHVSRDLIDFFDTYPTSAIGGNIMTRWAMYADTPLSEATRSRLYPSLRAAIEGKSPREGAAMLLNWVQTGFVYEYDEKVWGDDRAFFAEETLYYPYCDCEDRSILYSRLVRDLLGLDVVLVFYPGHLATAVDLGDDSGGSTMVVDGRKFTVCDPTYIGAPVGRQMPGMDSGAARAILLSRK